MEHCNLKDMLIRLGEPGILYSPNFIQATQQNTNSLNKKVTCTATVSGQVLTRVIF